MPQITTKRRVSHSAVDMFDLVADVEQYPRFVPFCRDLRVLRRDQGGEDGTEVLVANMTVADIEGDLAAELDRLAAFLPGAS